MRRIRTTRFVVRFTSRRSAEPAPNLADLQAGRKSFEISLLLVSKVGWASFDIHALRRSSCGYLRLVEVAARKSTRRTSAGQFPRVPPGQPRCCGNPSRTVVCDDRPELQHSS